MNKDRSLQTRRVYLLGGGNGGEICPYDNERWGVNATCIGKEVDLSFHLHNLARPDKYYITGTNRRQNADFTPFLSYVKLANHPVFSIKEYEGFPSIKRYPYEDVVDFFGTNYFSNSLCYMLALAIMKGYKEIHMYGMNFLMADEYVAEIPGVMFWIAMAHSRGIRIGKEFRIIGDLSKLLKLPGNINYAFEQKLMYLPEPVPRYAVCSDEDLRRAI